MITLLLLFFSSLQFSHASGSCSFFRDCDNQIQSNTAQSLPSNATATSFNPSNVAHFKGLGAEILYQPNNPVGFNLLTGNGYYGAALLSPNAEGSFFGNRPIEIDDTYKERRIDKKRYRTSKLNLALGASLINQEYFGFDLGFIIKRNPDVKKINPGVGVSTRIGFLNLGANFYKDDTKIELGNFINPRTNVAYSTQYNSSTYTEDFLVKTFSLGLSFGNFALDSSLIKTKYDFYPNETSIMIYSTSYRYEDFLFSTGYRRETSDNQKENNGTLYNQRDKKDIYGGIQYFWNTHINTGIYYNNFLVHDVSMTLTFYF